VPKFELILPVSVVVCHILFQSIIIIIIVVVVVVVVVIIVVVVRALNI